MLTNLFQLVVLVGSVNWLVTGIRLTLDNSLANAATFSNTTLIVPDALYWGGSMLQQIVYYLVGSSGIGLLVMSINGFWIRQGDPIISCSTV
jgi:uncharacterized membrane protein YuzA (DUF378 family)